MEISFGFCAPIFAAPGGRLFRTPNYRELDARTTIDLCRKADGLGYDSLWVADHLMLGKDQAILEGWTTLAALAAATSRARLGVIHQSNLLRHPAMAAKMSATLDQISGGRLIHFYDLGNNDREHRAYGLFWSDVVEERVERMAEALELILALWQAREPVSFQGRFYHLEGAVCQPQPVQKPHPPIWVGETHPSMLRICARWAQGWNTVPVSLEILEQRLQTLAAACRAEGRDLAELEISVETQILVAPDRSALRQKLQDMVDLSPSEDLDPELVAFLTGQTEAIPSSLADSYLIGTPDEVEQRIRAYIDRGVSHFLLWFMDAPEAEGLELFAAQVASRFR